MKKNNEITLDTADQIRNKFWSEAKDVKAKTEKRQAAQISKRPLYLIHSSPTTKQ